VSLVRRLAALALAAPLVVAVAAPSQARIEKGALNACQTDCQSKQRKCSLKCMDDETTCRQPCGCPDTPHTCTQAQKECHGHCANRLFGCANVCKKEAEQCNKKC
jgi:hypothetical protein